LLIANRHEKRVDKLRDGGSRDLIDNLPACRRRLSPPPVRNALGRHLPAVGVNNALCLPSAIRTFTSFASQPGDGPETSLDFGQMYPSASSRFSSFFELNQVSEVLT
jgi:hypothetical protein